MATEVPKKEAKSEFVQESVVKVEEPQRAYSDGIGNNRSSRRRGRIRASYFPIFPCTKQGADMGGDFEMEVEVEGERTQPTHLVVMVNGLIGSAQNWRFAARQFVKRYPREIVVHCSECNPSMMTFDGVDKMGDRVAAEVKSVIKRHPSVKKISFVGHSLGGLVARYAIAKLYEQEPRKEFAEANGECKCNGSDNHPSEGNSKGKIAGLEPMNFITSATPHLGSRGHKQVPVLCGLYTLEKLAARSSWFLGRTGRHLFLTDNDGEKPLLLQMVDDTGNIKYMSALQAFHRRVVYANSSSDHLVGWRTSSLRRLNELPKRNSLSRHKKYRHVVSEEIAAPQEEVPKENKSYGSHKIDIEEEMLRKLRKLRWERVDVSFHGSLQRFFAHSTIQVKTYCINSHGADVVQHMIDHFQM